MEQQNYSFGKAMCEKLSLLRYPKDHLFVSWSDVYPLPIEGCTEDEITQIKEVQGVGDRDFPYIYGEFLKYLGKCSGDLFIGYDLTYPYLTLYNFKSAANDTLKEDGHEPLDENCYVFMNKQGVVHWYFQLNNQQDPSVFCYGEYTGEDDSPFKDGPVKVTNRLSEFLTVFIEERESKAAQQQFLLKHADV